MFWATLPDPPPTVNLLFVQPTPAPATYPDPFDKGTWSVDFNTAFTQPAFADRHRFVTGTLGAEYALYTRLTVGLEIDGDYMEAPGGIGWGGGFNVRGRLELFRLQDISLFADASAGLIESDHPVPYSGTHFNFIETVGIGVYVPIAPRIFLEGGGRYEHTSNAGISVNPGYEGVQVYLGICVPL
jgi:hypothetical protein